MVSFHGCETGCTVHTEPRHGWPGRPLRPPGENRAPRRGKRAWLHKRKEKRPGGMTREIDNFPEFFRRVAAYAFKFFLDMVLRIISPLLRRRCFGRELAKAVGRDPADLIFDRKRFGLTIFFSQQTGINLADHHAVVQHGAGDARGISGDGP